MAKFMPNVKISEVHGKPSWVRGRLIIPMFHPAAALHQPSLKTSVERDFARLPEWIQQARRAPAASSEGAESPAAQSQPVSSNQAQPVSNQPVQPSLSGATLFDLTQLAQPEPEEKKDNASQEDNPTQLTLF